MGKYEEALKYASKASELTDNRSPLVLMNRASIYMHMGMIQKAQQDMDRASK